MSFGAIYCESWWGSGIGSDGWGKSYPIATCGSGTVDSTNTTVDTLSITTDQT
tara:strand:- start:332 stop:490 length:159 start_codon:yes stop_codon:yes gene_type:complete